MSRATGTLVLIAVVVAATTVGSWWARSLIVEPPTAAPLVHEVLRAHSLEIVDRKGNARVTVTASEDGVLIVAKGTTADAPSVSMWADDDSASVNMGCPGNSKHFEIRR
jgi:hypothetical protein